MYFGQKIIPKKMGGMDVEDNRVIANYLTATPYGSFELKEELRYRAKNAIRKGDISKLYGEAVLFKPDDYSIERHTEEGIRNYIHAIGFDDFVSRVIEENFLRERLAGRFAALTVEEAVLNRIKQAIEIGNIEKIACELVVNYYDRGMKVCTIDKETMVAKLKNCGVWDFVCYKVWLRKNTLSV